MKIMETTEFKFAAPQLREAAHELYEESFPEKERRSRAAQEAAAMDDAARCRIITDDGSLAAIVYFWLSPEMLYLEFLAVAPSMRGQSIGAELLRTLRAEYPDRRIVLEIEPPIDGLALRRLGFYRRNGYVANGYDYVHPSYRLGEAACPHPLVVMSHGTPLSREEYDAFLRFMRDTVLPYSD